MQLAWAAFRDCGSASWLCLLLGLAGTGAGILGVVLLASSGRRVSAIVGGVAVALGALALGSGVIGRQAGLGNTEEALAAVSADPSMVTRIRAEGRREANQCVVVGAGAGALPFLLGAITLGIGFALKNDANG
jgi:hypothetical protein